MNPQEALWKGSFGDDYQRRAPGDVEANRVLFERALRGLQIRSVIEFGAGRGANLAALRTLLPNALLSAVEINQRAAEHIADQGIQTQMASILEWIPPCEHPDVPSTTWWDLALTKGLLIHIPPEGLPRAYEALHSASSRYIMLAEYYCPIPRTIPYRGQDNALWARDFAGEMLERFSDLRLVDYGFVYRRDPYPQDDLTWFLLEKHT